MDKKLMDDWKRLGKVGRTINELIIIIMDS
jgi:hypothetical protein